MPRRNKPVKHTPFVMPAVEKDKVRYATKQAAEKAAELGMLRDMQLELTVYQGQDGGWYLTSRQESDD